MSQEFLERANEILDILKGHSPKEDEDVFCIKLLERSKIVKIVKNHLDQVCVTFSVMTEPWMRNNHDIVHGGFTATMVDYLTTYAAIADPTYWRSEDGEEPDIGTVLHRVVAEFGLSRHISVQYQRAIPINQEIFVDCVLESSTRRFIYITCKIHDGNGRIYATGAHDKVKQVQGSPKI